MNASHRSRWAAWSWQVLAAAALSGLAACGGGGSDSDGASTGGYYAVQGLRSTSSAIYTACIDNIEFVDPKSSKGQAITASLVNYYGLSNWVAQAGTGQSCKDKYPFADTTLTVDFYNQAVAGTPAGSGGTGTGTGGTGAGGGTSSGGTGSGGAGVQYIEWSGSVNGVNINDKDDEFFRAVAGSGQVTNSNGNALTGLTVVNGSQLAYNGSVIGYVGSASAQGGGQLAQMYCSSGGYLDIIVLGGSWQYRCDSGQTGGGSSSSGGSSRGFITWTGSVNGEVVIDASDERFRFYADSRCIYSDNTQTEYSNFCLPSSGTTVVFQGNTYTVSRVLSTTNQCITGLITSDGYYADIFTGSGGIQQISTSNKQPVGC